MTAGGGETTGGGEEMAAWRDASWYDSPGTAWRYHIANGTAESAVAACCSWRLLDAWEQLGHRPLWRPAADVPVSMRCQRNGCRQRWPAN